mmetsp:Transcript_20899/g.30962  ORF Transcript_20899/g.30962 Transcript_20899/m.30962 type:complete len:510 (+) Transcript_20899:116-1645(+)|eukprot:CAMPEP_0194216832 /NCGR_PEP_ID=MMETSP0156-20130528/19770_1 /TAXON_ID=33649 /ORGANISM="Thalassionema nitzschioides, Strain L26-B" /LENGTH=509 /DNA_ID=CAMNT_0038945689 /DNA_START=102 /DNA_END=1631 /DNA_ORIENTATION=+
MTTANSMFEGDSSSDEELNGISKDSTEQPSAPKNDGDEKDEETKDAAAKLKESSPTPRRIIEDEDNDDEVPKDKEETNEKEGEGKDDVEFNGGNDGEEESKDKDEIDEKKDQEKDEKKEKSEGDEDEGDAEFDDGKEEGGKKKGEDEDDAEFDDTGAEIVGSAAPKKDKPKSVKRLKTMTVVETTRPKSDVSLHMMKLPNLVGIQPDAFEHDSFSAATEEKEYKGHVHNMIRWRYKRNEDGELIRNSSTKQLERESNTRLVKWEDGSMTLHIGSEVFVCDQIQSSQNDSMPEYPGLNGYMYLSQKATNHTEIDGVEEEEPGGTVLECMGPIVSKITPRPSSLQSEAHKALTVAVRQKTLKRAKIAEFVTQEDPEKAKEERIRTNAALDKDKAARRRNNTSFRRRTPGMNTRYMDDEYDSVDVRQIKRGNYNDEFDDYGTSDEDEEDDGKISYKAGLDAKRKKEQQRREQEDDSEEEEFNAQESDDEEQVTHKNKFSAKKRANVFDEDDD